MTRSGSGIPPISSPASRSAMPTASGASPAAATSAAISLRGAQDFLPGAVIEREATSTRPCIRGGPALGLVEQIENIRAEPHRGHR